VYKPEANSSNTFFYQVFENRGVLVLRPDSWRERPRSTSTPCGAKVLTDETGLFWKKLPSRTYISRE